MNKTHKVLPVEDYYVVVDKEGNKTTIDRITDGEQIKLPANQTELDSPMWFKIIATIGKQIEGIPLIELPEKNAYTEALIEGKKVYTSDDTNNTLALGGFIRGYKAATKTYSEEDMRKALREVALWGAVRTDRFEEIEKVIKSLQPVPIEVTLEYEEKVEILSIGSVSGAPPKTRKFLALKSPINVVSIKWQ